MAGLLDRGCDGASVGASFSADDVAVLSLVVVALLVNERIQNEAGLRAEIVTAHNATHFFVVAQEESTSRSLANKVGKSGVDSVGTFLWVRIKLKLILMNTISERFF